MLQLDEKKKGVIVSALVPGNMLLISKLGDWYRSNPHHKFDEGDILILKNGAFGYGIRPVALVNGYEIKDRGFGDEGVYDISMARDKDFVPVLNESGIVVGNGWTKNNQVPKGVERILSENEGHFKWNIENQFKKIPTNMCVEDAVQLYRSQEVELK